MPGSSAAHYAEWNSCGGRLFDLTGFTALVTGASAGLGARMARVLSEAGAQVVLIARRADRLVRIAETLPGDSIVIPADLASPEGVADLLAELEDRSERIDILINNASMQTPARATEIELQAWDEIQLLNVRTPFVLARTLASQMMERGWGRIINISSFLAFLAESHASPYVTSKSALLGTTRSLAVEFAKDGVTVNALCPGWLETDMVADVKSSPTFDQRVIKRVPMGRWGNVTDLDGAILFLSSHASDFMTGQTLVIDGGLTATW